MDGNEESFYDSLEEDQNCDQEDKSPRRHRLHKKIKPHTKNPNSPDKSDSVKKPVLKIPLYEGETNADDLKKCKKNAKTTDVKNSSTCISCNQTVSRQIKIRAKNVCRKSKEPKTYWGIYCRQNGIRTDEEPVLDDTARSECGTFTNKTVDGFSSCCDLDGPNWDTPSMYANFLVRKDYTSSSAGSSDPNLMSEENDENFRSVSQVELRNGNFKPLKPTKTKKSVGTLADFVPLDQLGPKLQVNDPKVERLKKQQEYGIRASNKNRAKIIYSLTNKKS